MPRPKRKKVPALSKKPKPIKKSEAPADSVISKFTDVVERFLEITGQLNWCVSNIAILIETHNKSMVEQQKLSNYINEIDLRLIAITNLVAHKPATGETNESKSENITEAEKAEVTKKTRRKKTISKTAEAESGSICEGIEAEDSSQLNRGQKETLLEKQQSLFDII